MKKFRAGDRVRFNDLARKQLAELTYFSRHFDKTFTISGLVPLNPHDEFPIAELDYQDESFDGKINVTWLELAPVPIDPAKKLRSRNGCWEVIEVISTKAPGDKPLVVAVKCVTSRIEIWSAYPDGRSHLSSDFDLIEVPPTPKEYEGHMLVRRTVDERLTGDFILAEKDCPPIKGNVVARLHLKFREGEGLEGRTGVKA
jgi:hypothetical protein